MKHIIKAFRILLGVPFVSIGAIFYWIGEQVAGQKYARRATAVRQDMVNGMNRRQYRRYRR